MKTKQKYLVYLKESKEFAWLDLENNLTIANIDNTFKYINCVLILHNTVCFNAFKFASKLIPVILEKDHIKILNDSINEQISAYLENNVLYWY